MRSLLPTSLVFFLFGSLAFITPSVNAVKIPFHVRTTYSPSSSISARRLQARQSNSSSTPGAPIPIHNTHNSEYIANITLGGVQVPVLLDTGSSDLWVASDVTQTKDLGKSLSLTYAVGTAAGNINTADLEFVGYTIPDQAYLLVKNTSTFSINIQSQGFNGLIGLGPNTGSSILNEVDDSSGDSVLSRIFSQNSTAANYLTLLLNRIEDPGSNFTGQLTISEIVPGYENITNQAKMEVDKVHKLTDRDQHWQSYTDVNGIIGPDGNAIEVDSIVPSAPDGQLVAVFDSGYTLPQVPRAMADAIYGRVQGAQYNSAYGFWMVPCTQYLNVSFWFGGVEFPIHPLDISSSDFDMVDATGNPVCVGTLQPITSAFSLLGEYDIILGMGFLRNAYTLFDYGSWVEDSSRDQNPPFVQMLPTTDKAAAKKDFIQVRLNGVDTTGNPSQAFLPASQEQKSPLSPGEKKKQYEEEVLSRWPYIFVGCLVFVIILIGVITWRCCVRCKRRKARRAAAALGIDAPSPGSNGKTAYATFDGQSTPVHLKTLTPVYSNSSSGYPNPSSPTTGSYPDTKYDYGHDSFYGGGPRGV